MADKNRHRGPHRTAALTAELFAHRVIIWWLPLLYLLISSAFYLRTYDSAQVKITLMQMGGLALLTLWLSRLFEAGRSALSRDDLVCLSPFLAYLVVGIGSFLHAPYNMSSVDFFLRHFFFMIVALIVIYEFDEEGSDRLTRILIMTAWIACLYGLLQFIDIHFFPRGVGKGIDPFIWRGAFGLRVFSTYGNPNFFGDFLVIMFPIILMRYLQSWKWSHLALIALLLLNLYGTVTKGAWLGFAMTAFLFGVMAFVYFKKQVEPFKKWIIWTVVIVILGVAGRVGKELHAGMVSVNFRLFTWEATWEMIQTQPWIGTGVGSFPPIYPAFRRPPIFHIEGKHNTETDHSENEHIEQMFDNGILGFGIFIWLVLSTLVVGFRSLGRMVTVLTLKGGRPPPRAYDLVGYLVAFMGMLGHNFFDVSMRFVSSGVYLGLLSGMIVNLSRGKGLFELHGKGSNEPATPSGGETPGGWALLSEFLIWPSRVFAWAGLAYMAVLLMKEFSVVQGPVRGMGGEILQWWIAWGTFIAVVVAMTFAFFRLVYLSQKPLVAWMVLGALLPLHLFWGYFKADVHHNIAIFFSKSRKWDKALDNYLIVGRLNPNFVMSLYFKGNVFNDRFKMDKVYNPAWGDKDEVPRDDFERAMDAYDEVRALAPNYVQMHHQVGNLHMKRAEWASRQADEAKKRGALKREGELRAKAGHFLERALTRFTMYHSIDPVFAPNFMRIGQIFMMQKRYKDAVRIYEENVNADKCRVAASLRSKDGVRNSILSYQTYRSIEGDPHPGHRHDRADGYFNLANAYFMDNRWRDSEAAYKKTLALQPNNQNARRNLSVLYQKAQSLGRLKAAKPDGAKFAGKIMPFTGYEVLAPRK